MTIFHSKAVTLPSYQCYLSWSFFLFNFFFLSLFEQQRVCGYLFNLNECLQIHALLLHLITMVCLFKQQAKSYHVVIFEGIIRILCIHKNYTGFEKSWPTNMNNQSQNPFSTSSAFYFILYHFRIRFLTEWL